MEQPSSPSVKKTEEKGVTVVHEVKCKLYVKVIFVLAFIIITHLISVHCAFIKIGTASHFKHTKHGHSTKFHSTHLEIGISIYLDLRDCADVILAHIIAFISVLDLFYMLCLIRLVKHSLLLG